MFILYAVLMKKLLFYFVLSSLIFAEFSHSERLIFKRRITLADAATQKAVKQVRSNGPGEVLDVEFGQDKYTGNTRIIFVLSKPFQTDVYLLSLPFRLMFDAPMPYSWKIPDKKIKSISTDYVKGFRHGVYNEDNYRVVLDLKYGFSIRKVFMIKGKRPGTYELYIDLVPVKDIEKINITESMETSIPKDETIYKELGTRQRESRDVLVHEDQERLFVDRAKEHLKTIKYPLPKVTDSKKYLVLVDPGHGGKDAGTQSTSILEKDLVLDVSQRVAKMLQGNKYVGVALSRNSDFYIPLADRLFMARYVKASLFVSIHADRSTNPRTSGFSVYTLSDRASDVESQLIARNENKSDIVAGVSKTPEGTEVAKILFRLSQRYNMNESIKLSQIMLSQARKNVAVATNPIRSAGFVVLKTSKIPSILIEIGFLSNQENAKKLGDEKYKNKIAFTIASSIAKYLSKNAEERRYNDDYIAKLEKRYGLAKPKPAPAPANAAPAKGANPAGKAPANAAPTKGGKPAGKAPANAAPAKTGDKPAGNGTAASGVPAETGDKPAGNGTAASGAPAETGDKPAENTPANNNGKNEAAPPSGQK